MLNNGNVVKESQMKTKERVAVFIDGGNLYSGVKEGLHLQKSVKVEMLAKKLAADRLLVRIYYYTTSSPRPDSAKGKAHQKFLDKLGWIDHLQVRLGRLVPREIQFDCQNCGERQTFRSHLQKGVDTRIVVDMVTMAVGDSYDTAVLVSGDSDLAEAVNFIREHTNKQVENACVPGKGWAKTLREAADKRISLTKEYLSDCLIETSLEEQAPL
jgi:uncharacterized LabA/DUF88 family protein